LSLRPSSRIEPVTLQLIAQCLNQRRHRVSPNNNNNNNNSKGTRGGAVGGGTELQAGGSRVRIPMMALNSNQPLTDLSIRNNS
jgi:hypothetical protein